MTSYFRLRVLVLPYIALTLACFTHGFQHQNAFTVRQFPQAATRTGSLSHANTNLQQPLRRKLDVINKKPVIYLHQSASASLDGKESSVTPSILSQVFSHRNASILYFLTSIILANPVSMVEGSSAFKLMSMQPGQYNAAKVGGVMGFFMASSISYMLHKFQQKDVEAGENDDVNVDIDANIIDAPNQSMNEATLRKLNFGLMIFAFIGLFAVPGESAMLSNSANAVAGNNVMTTAVLAFIMQHFTRAIGLVAAFRGWVATNGIFTPQQPSGQFGFLNELTKGFKQTWIDGKKRKKTIYSTVFAFSLLGMVNNFMSFQHVAKVCTRMLFGNTIFIFNTSVY